MQGRWPDWWDWQLELTPHLLRRMEDRDLNEIDLRAMLHDAATSHADVVAGRWIIEARLRRSRWEIIVEPDRAAQRLIVITAYRVVD